MTKGLCVASAHLGEEIKMEACCPASEGKLCPGGGEEQSGERETPLSTRIEVTIHRHSLTFLPSRVPNALGIDYPYSPPFYQSVLSVPNLTLLFPNG
jgi:hypothetical protein